MEPADSITQLANDFGLFGITSVLLGVIAIALVIAGVIGYWDIRRNAREIAEKEARATAEKVAERVGNAYIQSELPAILNAYRGFAADDFSDEDADSIAEAQEGGTPNA